MKNEAGGDADPAGSGEGDVPLRGVTYRVVAEFSLHVTADQLEADLGDASPGLAAQHPVIVTDGHGRSGVRLDVTASDIWTAILDAMASVTRVFEEPSSIHVTTISDDEATLRRVR